MCCNDTRWFAMRATYGRNMMAQRALDMVSIESFVPMHRRTTKVGRHIKSDMVPIVRDLIFVHATKESIKEAKTKIAYLHYITRPIEGRNAPIEVPNEQMEEFIRLCEGEYEVTPLDNDVVYNIGGRVRIKSGSLNGTTGRLVRIQGKRTPRFSISIEGVCTLVAEVGREDIEPIES